MMPRSIDAALVNHNKNLYSAIDKYAKKTFTLIKVTLPTEYHWQGHTRTYAQKEAANADALKTTTKFSEQTASQSISYGFES